MDPSSRNELLQSLEREEQDLERLRSMVAPEYWPRIYAMLRRVREALKEAENENHKKAA